MGCVCVCVCAHVFPCMEVCHQAGHLYCCQCCYILLYLFLMNTCLTLSQKLNRGRKCCSTVEMDYTCFVCFFFFLNLWQSASTICVCLLAGADRCACMLWDSLPPNVLAGVHTHTHTLIMLTHTAWGAYNITVRRSVKASSKWPIWSPNGPQWLREEITSMKLVCQHVLIEHNRPALPRLM